MPTLMATRSIMDILRTTVPKLESMTAGVPPPLLSTITDYGWSVAQQLGHLRACHDVLGGNALRIIREDHPSWAGMSPRTWQERTDYLEQPFAPAFAAFRAQRAELLEVVEAIEPDAWERTATVRVPPRQLMQYSARYYLDWMARHERGHLRHMARVIEEARASG